MSSPLANQPFTLPGRSPGAVLLVHGLGGGTYELQWLGEHLHAHLGLTVRAMHLAGHDQPRTFMPRSTHEGWLESVRHEHAALAASHGVVHVIGFSTGCLVALRLAETQRLAGKLVLLAPFVDIYRPPFLPFRPEVLLGALPSLSQVPRRPPPLRDRSVRAQVSRVLPFSTMNLHAARSAKALGAVVLADAGKVEAPTLILQGAKDTVVAKAGASRLSAALRCEHRVVMLEDSDHLVALDRERARAFDEIAAFLG